MGKASRDKGAALAIVLPWPDKALSPNKSVHWAVKAKAKKKARHDAYYEALRQNGNHALNAVYHDVYEGGTIRDIKVQCTFRPKTKHEVDEDNCLAAMKAAFDGIADALGVDDKMFRQQPPIIGDPIKGGQVIVNIEVPNTAEVRK